MASALDLFTKLGDTVINKGGDALDAYIDTKIVGATTNKDLTTVTVDANPNAKIQPVVKPVNPTPVTPQSYYGFSQKTLLEMGGVILVGLLLLEFMAKRK